MNCDDLREIMRASKEISVDHTVAPEIQELILISLIEMVDDIYDRLGV